LLTGAAGAVVTFDGVVRDNTKGRRVISLQYEAYEPMAVKEMRRIGAEIRERWPDVERIGIIHRFGPLKISESSVVIVVTSPHRRVAFDACRYAIDRLKQTVPIWKKEIFEDGEEWVEGQPPELSQ
jgi:molybdopterin synthase catalytic subunit